MRSISFGPEGAGAAVGGGSLERAANAPNPPIGLTPKRYANRAAPGIAPWEEWLKLGVPDEGLALDQLPVSFMGALKTLLERASLDTREAAVRTAMPQIRQWFESGTGPAWASRRIVALETRLGATGALIARLARPGPASVLLQPDPTDLAMADGWPKSFTGALRAAVIAARTDRVALRHRFGGTVVGWYGNPQRVPQGASLALVEELEKALHLSAGTLTSRISPTRARVRLRRNKVLPPLTDFSTLPADFDGALALLMAHRPAELTFARLTAALGGKDYLSRRNHRGRLNVRQRPLIEKLEQLLLAPAGTLTSRAWPAYGRARTADIVRGSETASSNIPEKVSPR